MGTKIPIEIRFWAKVNKTKNCWLWFGKTTPTGYGQIQVGSRTDNTRKLVYVHRLSYEMEIGSIPKGLTIDHKCRVRNCVNPVHLRVMTLNDNLKSSPGYVGNKKLCNYGHNLDGLNNVGHRYCKTCRRLAATKSRSDNPEKHRIAMRRYREKNKPIK